MNWVWNMYIFAAKLALNTQTFEIVRTQIIKNLKEKYDDYNVSVPLRGR